MKEVVSVEKWLQVIYSPLITSFQVQSGIIDDDDDALEADERDQTLTQNQ